MNCVLHLHSCYFSVFLHHSPPILRPQPPCSSCHSSNVSGECMIFRASVYTGPFLCWYYILLDICMDSSQSGLPWWPYLKMQWALFNAFIKLVSLFLLYFFPLKHLNNLPYILLFIIFIIYSTMKYKLCKGRYFLSAPLLNYSKCLEQDMLHSGCSVDICWVYERAWT